MRDKLEQVPENLIPEISDFIDFLLSKYGEKKSQNQKLTFDWEGGLAELKNTYTSVELQHKALEWR
ncbi:DUF2281 domain-containing protein [candidate division KSB1 bacterium]|nr:DUF2281 domain-containing protein [candidate division KSB1 bacterium]